MNLPVELGERINGFVQALDDVLAADVHVRAFGELAAQDESNPASILSTKAARIWREHLRENGSDAHAIHHLAIIYHGLAFEAERDDSHSDKEVQGLWTVALKHWSALWRNDSFWEEVKTHWLDLKAADIEKRDRRADLFNPEQWDAFRRRLPGLILAPHREIPLSLADHDPQRTRMHLSLVKASGFDADDCDNVRRSVYAAYQPSIEDVKRNASFGTAVTRIQEYLNLDDDFAVALWDLITVKAEWIKFLASSLTGHEEDRARLDDIVEKGKKAAQHPSLLALAEDDPVVRGDLAKFYLAEYEYCMERASKCYESKETHTAVEWFDRAIDAGREAMQFDRGNIATSQKFFLALRLAVQLRLSELEQGAGSAFTKAKQLVEMGLSVDPNEPGMMIHKATVLGMSGDKRGFKRELARAREKATARNRTELLDSLEQLETNGPFFQRAVQLFNDGAEDLEADRPFSGFPKLEKAAKLAPENPDIAYGLVIAYFKNHKLAEAKRAAPKAVQLVKGRPDLEKPLNELMVFLRRIP